MTSLLVVNVQNNLKILFIEFVPFLDEGVANFKFIFLSHFSINFEHFAAYPAAFMMNFPNTFSNDPITISSSLSACYTQ